MRTGKRDMDLKSPASAIVADFQSGQPVVRHDFPGACQGSTVEYASYLNEAGLPFQNARPYLIVGELPSKECWNIHISVVRQQMGTLLALVLGTLIKYCSPFVVPVNSDHHSEILDGRAGFFLIGKVVSCYIGEGDTANRLAGELTALTKGLQAPQVPTAAALDDCVYVSYEQPFISAGGGIRNKHQTIHVYNYNAHLKMLLSSKNIEWPFSKIVALEKQLGGRFIGRRFLPIVLLKNDAKGKVWKGIFFKSLFNMQWCVVKQGNKFQCFDDSGRDIRDRLRWQLELHRQLERDVHIPKVLDWFEIDGDAYLTLEHIDGSSFSETINQTLEGVIWRKLNTGNKRRILTCLMKIIAIINNLHNQGFVHRDINAGNFLAMPAGNMKAIDLELSYNYLTGMPLPAFTLGTPGYMSPQQVERKEPTIEDDIFSIGALMIKALTGLSPNKLNCGSAENLANALQFLIGNHSLVSMIQACLNTAPEGRPSLEQIRNSLRIYHAVQLTIGNIATEPPFKYPEMIEIKRIVQKAINGLASGITGSDNEWLSKQNDPEGLLANEYKSYSWQPGWYSGVSGIFHVVSIAESQGLNVDAVKTLINNNLKYLIRATDNFQSASPGLWQGSYGIAIGLQCLSQSPGSQTASITSNEIINLLMRETNDMNIATGLAGQGLAILFCWNRSTVPALTNRLIQIANLLMENQGKNGAWLLKRDADDREGVQLTGFAYGNAGIAYFLLEYYSLYKDQEVKIAVMRVLNWLKTCRTEQNGHGLWQLNPKNPSIDPWLENGFTGIALVFIKAYEVIGDPDYKAIAVSALMSHPKFISSNYLVAGNGLAGLGQVYLEASRIFKESEWQERAAHIANFIVHTVVSYDDHYGYWLDGNFTQPTPGFLDGVSGIIHFLVRYLKPDVTCFPLTVIAT